MSKVLELKNVSKIIGKRKIVENINFDINSGEIFGFLGPNGAGKTTTIKMITGLLKIDEGEILINGKNVKTNFEEALSSVGGIIENPEMYGYLSGRDNLEIYGRMHGQVSKDRINEVINLVKLDNRIDDKVKKYSLGMRQRLGLAQALLHSPKLLILDEPTNGLDPVGIKELRDTLRELAEKEGLAVLVSSHLLSEMELMCDRFGIIDSGKIIDMKTMKDIRNQENSSKKIYEIEVDNGGKAFAALEDASKAEGFKVEATVDRNIVRVNLTKDHVALLNRILVKADVLVYTICPVENTLEDEFMKITTGSKSQIR
ncbi:MAG: ABC transporter ATP-binding protein [Clostridium sp.]|uniref:ABC transporter ATP-binding protein n=1 Tax=Clostridium culturomicium TaxID=1499683 RepID=UPI00058F3284|nr:ABC transporter ATP-binding protein [Clostridium culturomicium]MDU4889688.1 ABC transporter ATP-binding protein [Clostridium sp.]MDU7082668.1 ABC transporter ATP-binding protein [Clostridium sp.]